MPKDFTFEEATEPKEFSFEDAAPEPTYPPTYSPKEFGPESPTGREESLSPLTFAEWWKATPVRREMEQKFGAGGVPTPKELVDTAFKFASVPPQVAEPYRKITDAYYSALPPAIGGTAAGLRDVALEFPIAAGAVGMGKTMGRLVMGLFTGEYAIAIPEMWQAFKTAKEQGRTREAYQIATKAIAGGLLLGAGGAMEVAGMRGGKVPPVIAKPEAPKPPVIPEVPPETAALLPKAAAEVAKPEQPAAPAAQPEIPSETVATKPAAVEGVPAGRIEPEMLSKAASVLKGSPEESAFLRTVSQSKIPFYTSVDQVPNAPNLRYHGTWAQNSGAIVRNGLTSGMSHNYESYKGVGGIGDVTFVFDAGHPEVGVLSAGDVPHGNPIGIIFNDNPAGTIQGSKIKYALQQAQKGAPNAIQIGEPEAVPVGQAPGDRGAMGEGAPPAGEAALPQAPAAEAARPAQGQVLLKPFEVDDQLVMRSPHTGEDTLVSYRGKPSKGQAVVWTGKTQMQVPESWLRRQGEKYERQVESLAPSSSVVEVEKTLPSDTGVREELQSPSRLSKTELIDELSGPRPDYYASRVKWDEQRKRLSTFTKSDLVRKVVESREREREQGDIRRLVPSVQTEFQKIADDAGPSWKRALREYAESNDGVRINPPSETSKAESVAIFANEIAGVRVRKAKRAATAPPAGPGEGVPSKTAAASAALPVTSESGGVAAPPEAARQPPASTVSVKGQEKPSRGKKPREVRAGQVRHLFDRETEAVGGHDILDWINQNMRLRSKSAAKKAMGAKFARSQGEWDDAPRLPVHHNERIYGGRSNPDQVAQAAFEAGLLREPSVPELWQRIGIASERRRKVFRTGALESSALETAADFEEAAKTPATDKLNQPVSELRPGDAFEIEGQRIEVVRINPDGTVVLNDGTRWGRQEVKPGETLWVESFEEAKPAPKAGSELLPASEIPFNLVGEKGEAPVVKPEEAKTGYGTETLSQQEMFGIQQITNLKDPTKSADAAQQMYGGPEQAAKVIERQLAIIDTDKATQKAYGFDKKQRQRLSEVLALLRQRASPIPPAPGPGMGEGPGALTAGTPPTGKAQIEQLADAFKNKAPAGQRVAQLMRGSFDYGTRIAQAKDAVSRAISGLKSSGDALWTSLTKFEKPDELLQAKGQLSAELETRGWRVRQFANDVKRAIPDVRRRAAISKWIDSGGDVATLHTGMTATKPEYRQAYADAMNLRGDDLVAAQNISNYFEARLQEAVDAGVLEHGLDDYIHRIYEKDPGLVQRASAYVQSGILSKNPSLAKKRLFQFDWEAEAAGKRPVQDFLPRVTDYETSLSRAIAAREFIAKLSSMTASDGRPIIGVKGVGIPVEDPAGVRTGTLIQPKGDFKKANDPTDPGNYRGDYESRDYPSLRKWKWVGKDAADQDIFLQGDVAVHPEYAKRIDRLLAPSAVRKSPVGSAALGLGSTVKQTMLDFSLFHHVQIGVHAMEHRVMPWSIIKDIDFENPKVEGLLKGGVTLGGEYRGANLGEGLVGRSISRHIPGLGPVMESYHEWLFQSFIPRVKMTMALHALERNRARYAKDLASGRMTETDLNFLTAKQANAAFGELNYITMERSKTFQDMARLVLLAPDFLEARAKFAAQAFTKYGREQRVALFLGAAALYTAARVFNKLLDDQYHFEPENLFNVVYKNNAYSLRTVQGDLLHLYDKPMQFWLSRLNPVYGRTILEAASQRDYYGRKRTPLQIAGDAVSTVVPISMRSSRERHLWESFLNGVGITARRWNDVQTAYKLASEWKTKNHIREAPGEFVYDADKDPLRPLKIALSEGDEPGSVKEIGRVLASKALTLQQMNQYFQRYSRAPFTGSMGNDRKWYASLSKDHQQTVDAARQHRQAMWTLYSRARGQYFQSLSPTPLTP